MPRRIEIHAPNNAGVFRPVSAYSSNTPGLVVHRAVAMPGWVVCKPYPEGGVVADGFALRREALECARRLGDLDVDWQRPLCECRPSLTSIRRRVIEIAASCRNAPAAPA